MVDEKISGRKLIIAVFALRILLWDLLLFLFLVLFDVLDFEGSFLVLMNEEMV